MRFNSYKYYPFFNNNFFKQIPFFIMLLNCDSLSAPRARQYFFKNIEILYPLFGLKKVVSFIAYYYNNLTSFDPDGDFDIICELVKITSTNSKKLINSEKLQSLCIEYANENISVLYEVDDEF